MGCIKRHGKRIEGLFLLCPCVIAEASQRRVPEHTLLAEDKALLERLQPDEREEFSSIAVVQNEYIWERYNKEIVAGLNLADGQFMKNIKQNAYAFSFELDDIYEKPTLILAGRQDSFVGYKDAWDLLEQYPRATFGVIDRAGHNLQLEQVDIFNVMLSEWLGRVKSPST
ncbi:alpha/beta hydrolase [Paenibacillus sp. sgz500958]|uniref:alpha/beta hydrolase n=1 Tax=Paenibacillus sp. sgz500958 TaxID=3242475 RepID=UPI0036D3E4EF